MALLINKEIDTTKITSINPANLEVLGEAEIFDFESVKNKVELSKKAFKEWSKLTLKDRAAYLLQLRDIIVNKLDDLALLITNENGKPLAESITAELLPIIDMISTYTSNTNLVPTKEDISLGKWAFLNKKSYVKYEPLGVIGIISPWNYPFSIPVGQIIAALLCGNTVVLKPSEHTSLIGLEIEKLFKEAGFPENVVSVITGYGETGANLIDAKVSKIVFTGSVATGKKIMAHAATSLTPVILELGGKDPMIVLKDANIDVASSGAVWGAFTNAGQVCASIERVYVHKSIADEFTYEVLKKTKKLTQGIGTNKSNECGPMISLAQMEIVKDQLQNAVKKGGKILIGGERNESLEGFFFNPTVITSVDNSFQIIQEETFGPVLPIITYETEEEVIALANDSKYALTASIWTSDIKKAQKMANQIEAGTVSINDCVSSFALCQTPWGGPKESGIGRTHGKFGFFEFLEPKHVHIDNNINMKRFWWYGYDENRFDMFKQAINLLFTKNKVNALPKLIKDFMNNKTL
jgi:acyl-CoA reductase-like NAD-dependent aldehyde dehydrogenase